LYLSKSVSVSISVSLFVRFFFVCLFESVYG